MDDEPVGYPSLESLLPPDARLVRAGGVDYPAAVQSYPRGFELGDLLALSGGRASVDPELAAAGRPHLEALRSANPAIHDGEVAALSHVGEGGSLVCVRAGYFDMLATCDSLRAEYEAAGERGPHPLRELATARAGGKPLVNAHGRAAAVGVTVAVTQEAGGDRLVIAGRRSQQVATDPGRWHLIPSGMVETHAPEPLLGTVVKELREELRFELGDPSRLRPLGLGWDLLRLRPEICLHLPLTPAETQAASPLWVSEEFSEVRFQSVRRLTSMNAASLGLALTPAAAATLVLLGSRRVGNA